MMRAAGRALSRAAAALGFGWTAWRGAPSGVGTGIVWFLVVTTALIVAGLPALISRRSGPVSDSRMARWLRAGSCATAVILVVILCDLTHSSSGGRKNNPTGLLFVPWVLFLLLLAGYVAVVFVLTAQRTSVTSATLAVGTGIGVALGVMMYALMPLGFGRQVTAPWLPGADIDPVVGIAWTLLLAGPLVAALAAGWGCYGQVGELPGAEAKVRQAIAGGILVTLTGSLVVCVLGPLTLALLPDSAALLHLMYPHLTAARAAHRAAVQTSIGAPGYFLVWLFFPLFGLAIGALTALIAFGNETSRQPVPRS